MKIVYVGECDSLAAGVMERLDKEEQDVYFLSHTPVTKKEIPFSRYKSYELTKQSEDIVRIFNSITPDVVIYAGCGYGKSEWDFPERENLSVLAAVLEESVRTKVRLFLCLSSTEVYGNRMKKATEQSECCPETKKGMWMLQEEKMTEMYHRQKGLETVILRLTPFFSDETTIGEHDFLGELAEKLLAGGKPEVVEENLQLVHVSDVSDAVVRVIDMGKTAVYNVSSSKQRSLSEIVPYILETQGKETEINVTKAQKERPYIDNSRLRKEQEWTDFWELGERIKEKHLIFHKAQEKTETKKADAKTGGLKRKVRQTIENLVVFLIFFLCCFLSRKHSLFSQVDWLLIYVVVISLCYGVKQGALAVGLSSVVYLMLQKGSILEMTNFYSYAGSVLMIAQFVFFGIVVGYTADMLRENIRNTQRDMDNLKQSYQHLKKISDKNILIKNEYEKRLLDAKTSLPRLHSIINRINVLDTERIFMEVLHVVEELMDTDTVAVYRVNRNNGYLRLIASLNEKSVVEGRSWNLDHCPAIAEAIRNNQIYEGDIWRGEPAVVLPIVSKMGCEAVIVIKELSMENMSLYSVNLLRTLFSMTSDALKKALRYESALREQKYIKDTNILYAHEFQKAVGLAEEKKQREMADYCVLRLCEGEDAKKVYEKLKSRFREVDVWGMDEKEGLCVLLANTSPDDGKVVIGRLDAAGIAAEEITNHILGALTI